MLEVRGLKKRIGENEILKGVDISIDKGDVVAVLGPSGSGKTTLLRCMNYLERADEGRMLIDDREYDMKSISKKEIAEYRRITSFVFQNYNLFLNRTAMGNVTEGLITARKMEKARAREVAAAALDRVGLADKYDSYPSELSGGQQQRVAIARAIATEPRIIYLDEPTSALDPELIGEVLDVIKSLADEGRTMLIVTHEINFAKNVSDRVVFLDEGEVIAGGDTAGFFDIQDNERVTRFLGTLDR
ncbi:MAG: amino acid ABC transporter ATP-binding protein [Lachnospiraceae bacterium]|nr:amino acid ABC transporter ATP-binding protein [Lachnospiraceae bacterium]